MTDKSWGQKRICSCGKIRFYDLNKSKIECPECAEIIDIDFLSNTKIEKNLLKKDSRIFNTVKDKTINKKTSKITSSEPEIEEKTTIDIGDVSKLSVKEITGDTGGKSSNKIDDSKD